MQCWGPRVNPAGRGRGRTRSQPSCVLVSAPPKPAITSEDGTRRGGTGQSLSSGRSQMQFLFILLLCSLCSRGCATSEERHCQTVKWDNTEHSRRWMLRLSFPPLLPGPTSSTCPGPHMISQGGRESLKACLLDQGSPSSSKGLSLCCWGKGMFGSC